MRHVAGVEAANAPELDDTAKSGRQTGKFKKVCTTDPEATMATNGRNRRLYPACKQHLAVDDKRGVILNVEVTTRELNEGQHIVEQVDRTAERTGTAVTRVTADAGYAYGKVYRHGRVEHPCRDPGSGRADPLAGPNPSFSVRRPERRADVPQRQGPAAAAFDKTRALLLLESQGLQPLLDGEPVPVCRSAEQGCRGERPSSCAPSSAST